MMLENIIKHISSSGFWRLFALDAKRLISDAKLFSKLPFIFNPLVYALHFLRSVLRLFNYFLDTKNKNLGETRKFFFSAFKVFIAITAFILCFFTPLPALLIKAFLLYSVVKLVDSTGVLIFSFVAYFKIDNAPENKWRRYQYWDNIIKHTSILAIGVAMTLLTAIVLAGSVAGIVWTSPVIILSLAIVCLVTSSASLYLCGLFYQRFKARKNLILKKVCDVKLKKFGKVFVCWLLCLTSVIVPFFCPAAIAFWLVPVLLGFYNLFDAGKSTYDYLDKVKVSDSKPADLVPKNSLEDLRVRDYYGCKDRVIYLKQPKKEDSHEKAQEKLRLNKLFVLKEGFVKLAELQYKLEKLQEKERFIPSIFSEKYKLQIKKKELTQELAYVLKSKGKDEIDLLTWLLEARQDLYKDREELLKKPRKSLSPKTQENIKNIATLEQKIEELCAYMDFSPSERMNINVDNFLIDLLNAYKDENLSEKKVKPQEFYQSFWRKRSESEALSLFFQVTKKIEEETTARLDCHAHPCSPGIVT